jgi:hypothetical protein
MGVFCSGDAVTAIKDVLGLKLGMVYHIHKTFVFDGHQFVSLVETGSLQVFHDSWFVLAAEDEVEDAVDDHCSNCGAWKENGATACDCAVEDLSAWSDEQIEKAYEVSEESFHKQDHVIIHKWLVRYFNEDESYSWRIMLGDESWAQCSDGFVTYYDLGVEGTYTVPSQKFLKGK